MAFKRDYAFGFHLIQNINTETQGHGFFTKTLLAFFSVSYI